MATFRVGVGSFNIQDGAVGFGTDIDGLGNLRVKGVTKTTDIKVSGASTLTRYSGFAADNINQLENITLTSEVGTIGDIVVGVGTSVIISSGSTVTVGTVESVSIGTHFSPPTGGIEERGEDFVEGMMRFNTDLNTMEFYNGNEWRQFTYILDIKTNPQGRGRGVIGGGHSYVSTIQAWEIATLGSAFDFGELTAARAYIAGNVASEIRGIFGGGRNPAVNTNTIDYITIASQGDAIDFGDQSRNYMAAAGMSSSTRGVFAGGYAPSLPDLDMEYVEIATLGNALDFGDLFQGGYYAGSVSSPTRGLYAGGHNPGPSVISTIQFLTIASLGNTVRFGDLTDARSGMAGGGNSVRGIFCGGYVPTAPSGKKFRQTIDYVTIASEGNAKDFGESIPSAATGISQRSGSGSNNVRAVFAGGQDNSSAVNSMEFVTIATTGNTQDFGDLPEAQRAVAVLSDSHGGLGGY